VKIRKFLVPTALVLLGIAGAAVWFLVATLNKADGAALQAARQVDAFILEACQRAQRLPAVDDLRRHFPDLRAGDGWLFFANGSDYLGMQYPMHWRRDAALGRPRISEFTATVYAYAVDYRCGKAARPWQG